MADEPPILELKGVTVTRRGSRVLGDVSLAVRPGEVVGISFVHGTGKSTLLQVAAGLIEPDAGEVLWRGKPLWGRGGGVPRGRGLSRKDNDQYRAETAMVFNNGGLLVNTTISNNIALPLRYHTSLSEAEIAAKVKSVLDVVGMGESGDRFPWELAIGKVRLASLARALVRDPALVLFDDFHQGSEAAVWRRLVRVVQDRRRERGTAFMLVLEADPATYAIADRLAVFDDGRLLEAAAPETLRASANHRVSGIFKVDDIGQEL